MTEICRLFSVALLLATALTSTHVTAQINNKDVTEVIVNGQQDASDWFSAESAHFIVYSDTSHDNVSKLLNKLERLDYLLRLYVSSESKVDNSPKLTLYYLKNFSDIRQIENSRPDYAIGLYSSCALGVQGFATHMYYSEKSNSILEKQPENEGLGYIFEAYARHFIYHNSNLRTPTWYIDGFAQYFASTRFSDTDTVVGMAPASINEYLSTLHSTGRYNSLDYTDILLQNDSNSRNIAGTAGIKLEFQARSWILTHYILSSSENIQRFRNYVNLITQNVEPTTAFEQTFGFKISQLSKTLWRYKWQSAEALKTNFSAGGTKDINFGSLPKIANTLILADAALKSCPNTTLGLSLLEKIRKATKQYPSSDYAQLILSRAEINFGDAKNSLPYLTEKTSKDPSSFDAFYLLGLAQFRLAEQSNGESQKNLLELSQRNLLKAITLNPQAHEALYAYFKTSVNGLDVPNEQSLGAGILAWTLAREVSVYSKSAALIYAYIDRKTESQDALTLLLHNSRDPQMIEWAQSWKARSYSGITQAEILREMRLDPLLTPSFKEWTIATVDVMKSVALAANLEAAKNVIVEQRKQDQTPSGGSGNQGGN
ncbi:MAG: hypothetical protein EOO68_05745 [Moraxellaceae bacterium]|nr:MAG: hypothetical protein EOO68_05745 [Moraxellaceae bacterium]